MPNQDGMEIPSVSILLLPWEILQRSCGGDIPVPEGGLLGFCCSLCKCAIEPIFAVLLLTLYQCCLVNGRYLLVALY